MMMHARRRFTNLIRLAVVLVLPVLAATAPVPALAQPAATVPALAQPAVKGQWGPVFDTQNVMIHASVLLSGKVLFWSRREGADLNEHTCTPRIWDPAQGTGLRAFSETHNKPGYNLFCSGHAFLPDGRLFVVGGHLMDTHGVPFASIYDPGNDVPMGTPWTDTLRIK